MRPARYQKVEEMKQRTTKSDLEKLTDCGIRGVATEEKVAIEEGYSMWKRFAPQQLPLLHYA